MFNKLESIALSDQPRTPVLDCLITKALFPKYVENRVSFPFSSRSGRYDLYLTLNAHSFFIRREEADFSKVIWDFPWQFSQIIYR